MSERVEIRLEPATREVLAAYEQVPIAFTVRSRMRVGEDGETLVEEALARPYRKDYDALGDHPTLWADRYDTARWTVIEARDGDRWLGGAVLAHDTDGVDMLEGRRDLAMLWDVRVHPDHRRRGVGTRLFDACVAWARARACTELKVETQDVNMPACRFYAARGCRLAEVVPGAYAACPDETMLIWRLPLS